MLCRAIAPRSENPCWYPAEVGGLAVWELAPVTACRWVEAASTACLFSLLEVARSSLPL